LTLPSLQVAVCNETDWSEAADNRLSCNVLPRLPLHPVQQHRSTSDDGNMFAGGAVCRGLFIHT